MTAAIIANVGVSADRALLLLAAALFLALLTGIAHQWPTFTVLLFLLFGPLADVLHVTSSGAVLQGLSVGAIRPVDAVLTAMLAAALYRGVALAWARTGHVPTALRWTAILLAGWIILEVARNVTTYGLSAAGEFRYRYLVLAMPAYIALSFTRVEQRRHLVHAAILTATVLTLCFVPLIGLTKGWAVGPESRFLPAVLSVGLVLGWTALFLAVRAGVIRISTTLVWLFALPVAGLVLVDGHRSVWLVALAIPLTLLVLGELVSARVTGWLVPVGAVVGLIVVGLLAVGVNPVPYVETRAEAFTAPASDTTAIWRRTQWQAQLQVWRQNPVVGQGFGGYWSAGEAYGSADVSPHSLYVQTLVKLGIVGLGLLVALGISIAVVLAQALGNLRRLRRRDSVDYVLVVMGLIALAAVFVYGVAYALDYYALLFVGLGLAAAVHDNAASHPA